MAKAHQYTDKDLEKYAVGLNPQTIGFAFLTGAPLDDRTIVRTKAALLSDSTDGFKDTNGGKTWIYPGMTVTVTDPGDIYILTNFNKLRFYTKSEILTLENNGTLDAEIAQYWTKLPSQDDLTKALETNKKDLFTFKGVATGIDADHCIITVGCAEGSDDNNYTIEGTAYDILKEEMYGWGTESGKPIYWTHETSGVLSPVYIRGEQQNIQGLSYNGVTYYLSSTNVYQSLDGDFLYKKGGEYYTDLAFQNGVTGVKDESYHGYVFTEVEGFTLTLKNPDDGGKMANSDNIGHVYQIGEEEYASNGSIWVQLGSPKEDWIVIK